MQNIFIDIYNFFTHKKAFFVLTLIVLFGIIVFSLSRIKLEENINAIIPNDARINNISRVLNNTNFSDKIIITVTSTDTSENSADILKRGAEKLVSIIQRDTQLIQNITFKIEPNSYQNIYDFFYNHLPFYLTDVDYEKIGKLLNESEIQKNLIKDYKSLISPAGIATKAFILKDPLNITPIALKKLQNFQFDNNFILHNSCIFTQNKKNLLIFIEPRYNSGNTNKNAALIDSLDRAISEVVNADNALNIEYYGGTAVAVANAKRIKADIMLTVSIALLAILLVAFYFFRRFKVILFLFIPIILGAGLSLSVLVFIFGSISAIALGIGAVLIGISIDYSLHLFTHYRESGSITKTLADITLPLMMSGLTTAAAFLCLFIVKAEALNQLGMFAAFSVFFSSLMVLLILPYLIAGSTPENKSILNKKTFFDKITAYEIHKSKAAIIGIVVLSVLFLFTYKNIRFNSNLATLNYLPKHLSIAEKNLESISSETQSSVYIVTLSQTLDSALLKSESQNSFLDSLATIGLVSSKSSGTELLLSAAMQNQKIDQWNNFWDSVNREGIKKIITEEGVALGFKENAFAAFYDLINKDFKPIAPDDFALLKTTILSNYINTTDSLYSVISILKVDQKNKNQLFDLIGEHKDLIVFDKQFFSNEFFKVLNDNFNKLVWLSLLIVFGIILIFFGRIELALITFFPILLSWYWTLGIMGFFNIEFNIFNIIISTFIFGLGVDYSIFIVKGLLNNYKYGNHSLTPYKLSIFLSSITTIMGVGVLILAKHPALKSIALVSVIGISSVVLISFTVLPLLFNLLTSQNSKSKSDPVTLKNTMVSLITFLIFFADTLILTLLIPVLYIVPIPKKNKKYLYHYLIYLTSKIVVKINFTIKKTFVDTHKIDFSKPSVLISNHQSHLDLVLILMQHPKIIVITNKWVWNNPFYGFVVRFADYYPIYKGIETGFDKIKQKVSEGYSILVFPEGSRTFDGNINRYHQGAFKLADDLNLKIQPIIIHGAYQCLPKTNFFLRSGVITLKFLDAIHVESVNTENNETYRVQAKQTTRLVRDAYAKLQLEQETPKFYAQKVIHQYIYKGPVIEWYVRIKLRLENNYEFFNNVIPRKATIVDMGCGYGYFAYMLNCLSGERYIIGIDYDEEKIKVAQKIAEGNNSLSFKVQDIIEGEIPDADIYILNDVLHYMPENLQIKVLSKCLDKLCVSGMLIVRDADAELVKRTKFTKYTEVQSTRIFKFNKAKYDLSFISGNKIVELAQSKGFVCERYDNSTHTSNITYIIKNAH